MKILYVCPFSHYSGHHPYAAATEPEMLAKAGIEVALVTFCGVTNKPETAVHQYQVIHDDWHLLQWLRRNTLCRWLLMVAETMLTLTKALSLYRKLGYDVIYLRDGEPFLPISHILSVLFSGRRWVVSLTGANLFIPRPSMLRLRKNPFIYLYVAAQRLMNSRFWRLVYKVSLRRSKFMFTVQNKEAKRGYNSYQKGIFAGRVTCIPLGTFNGYTPLSKSVSREKLGLPQDRLILLSFGAPNSGKDIRTVVSALRYVPETFLVHAGTQAFSLGPDPKGITKEHSVEDRTAIFNYYIREDEKPLFFSSADALILSYTKIFKSTSSMLWEATKYRLPVISSNANTLGEMVKKYNLGLLFESEDPLSLAGAIRQFKVLKPSEIELMEEGRRRFIDDYSIKKWIEKHINVFEEVIRQ